MNTYFHERLAKLGITEAENKIMLWRYDAEAKQNVLKEETIFKPHEKGIEIIVYTLQRENIRIEKDGSRYKKNWSIIRLENPLVKPNGDTLKYVMPKGSGSYPLIPPSLIEKFETKTPIDTLYLTEGYFKCFKGAMHGIDIIGLASITHLKNKETGALHSDVLAIIRSCSVKRVVWLTDGDCLDISSKAFADNPKDSKDEVVDLYKR
ncbi:MAG TPA: hypothetical protein PL045_07060, partial [Chitinophagaceae bacterium]|nr:hypothetical protein [Chitinophagaceae bacterium]